MVSFLLGKQNFSFIIEGRTREKQWGCLLSAGCWAVFQKAGAFRLSDIRLPALHCHPERKKGAAYAAGSSVYRYCRFIVKEKKEYRKWNHLKFVFSIFYGIMGIERDSWYPCWENGSLRI